MPAIAPTARRALVLLSAALAALALVAVDPAGAVRHHPRHHRAKVHHHAHKCATVRHGRRRARHRARAHRSACVRVASLPDPTLVAPVPDATVSLGGYLRGRATVPAPVNHVTFRVDGRIVKRDYVAPYSFKRLATRVGVGAHRVQAIAAAAGLRYPSNPVSVDVTGSGFKGDGGGGDRSGDAAWAQGKTWASSFETGDFTEWSWWGQDQQSIWGHIGVVDPASAGVPSLGGSKVARFETTPDDIANGRYNAKLYKAFGTDLDGPDSRPPANVSGTYSAWYYVPDTYTLPGDSWVNLLQFKEEYRTPAGAHSDPLWWVQLGPVHWANQMTAAYGEAPVSSLHPDSPVAFISYWNGSFKVKRNFVPLPLDRWFELKAVVHQNDRIDFFIDGQPLDTARATTYPVSPFHGADSMNWTFGVGNYSTGANGPLYIDRASYSAG